jgi:methylated-DNA-protein-cysteine methyltransferase related protein
MWSTTQPGLLYDSSRFSCRSPRLAPVTTATRPATSGAAPSLRSMTRFEQAVVRVLQSLGPGEVVTYGEVAAEAGFPGRARAVGNILATSDGDLPWWRVVTSTGRLVPGHEDEHARRLRAEGVAVVDGRVPAGGGRG